MATKSGRKSTKKKVVKKKPTTKKKVTKKKVAKKVTTKKEVKVKKPVAKKVVAKKKKVVKKVTPKKKVKKPIKKATANKVVKKNVAKKVAPEKKVVAKKTTTKKNTPEKKVAVIPKKKVIFKKPAKNIVKKSIEKKAVAPQKIIAKKPEKIVKNIASAVYLNETKKSKKKQDNWVYQNRLFVLVIFVAVVVMNLWIFLATPQYTPTVTQQEIVNPVFDESAAYYKYNVPETDWDSFDGTEMVNYLVDKGIFFDEAIYQEGGKACDICPSNASPLLFVKNPNYILGRDWTRVAKPGFYDNTDQYSVYLYQLS